MTYKPENKYLEIWQEATYGNYIDRSVWFTEAPSGTIVNNSLPTDVCFTRENAPSGITYSTHRQDSAFDNVLWLRHSTTDKYLLEVDYLVKMYDSSEYGILPLVNIETSNSSYANPPFSQNAKGSQRSVLQSNTDYYTFATNEAANSGYTGRVQRILLKTTIGTSALSSSEAYGFGFGSIYSDVASNQYFDGHSSATTADKINTIRKHVKITKIA